MRITKKSLNDNWRNPEWEFHHETTYWYPLDERHFCLCAQDTEICFSGRSGIGYDVAIPGSYTVFVDEVDERRTAIRSISRTFTVSSHRELRRLATGWIYGEFEDDGRKGAA